MQNELESTYPLLKIKLLGVNLAGQESGNSLMTSGRDLPLLQDVDANQDSQSDAWTAWNAVWRDVFIVDGNNAQVGLFNLTQHNLATPSEYATLREMLLDAAVANQKPWMNPIVPHDVDIDGVVAPRDVLVTINTINRDGSRELPPPTGTTLSTLRYDVNGDNVVAPSDVLQVINYINSHGNSGNGEGEGIPLVERVGNVESSDLLTHGQVVVPLSTTNFLPPSVEGMSGLGKRVCETLRSGTETDEGRLAEPSDSVVITVQATEDHSRISAAPLPESLFDAGVRGALADCALAETNWLLESAILG